MIVKGFSAVPTLIKQREAKRFTNHVVNGYLYSGPSYTMTAGQVIDEYLQRLANREFGASSALQQTGDAINDESVLAWWKEASATGEEAYIREHTTAVDNQGNVRFSQELLLLAITRYPALLPELYRQLIATTSYSSWNVIEAIMKSDNFTRELKIKLLEEGIATNDEFHRSPALDHLQPFDSQLADKHLIRLLKKAPSSPKGKYWNDQNADLDRFVSGSVNPDVWQRLHELLNRADIGMRMEWIDGLNPPLNAPPEVLRSFHKVYLRFRDDKTVRDIATNTKFSGPGAAAFHNRIEMRNFIHMHWAKRHRLALKAPDEGDTPGAWKAYRDAVAAAIQ